MRMNDTSRINKDCATIAQSACVRRANQMSTKTKKSNKIVPMFDGCMNGRMSLFRKCVEQKKTTQETLEILRKKYPWGLTGTNAIRWITKHYMRIERKVRAMNADVASRKTRVRKSRKTDVATNATNATDTNATNVAQSNATDATNVATDVAQSANVIA